MKGMNTAVFRSRKRTLLVGGVAGVLVVGGLGYAATRDSDDDTPRGQTRAGDMAGMAGMDMGGMEASSDGSVRLTAAQIRQFGVTFGVAEQRPLEDAIRTVGVVNFDETRMAEVTPKFGGFVERLYVDFTGQPVRAGQPLLEIYSPELVAAQEELLLAAGLDRSIGGSSVPGVPAGGPDLAASARRRLRLWDISEGQIREIQRTGRVRRTLTLHAPVSGIVVEKQVLRGQAVQPGQTLYTIADLSEVWVEAELREADAGSVREGSAATVELTAFPGRPIPGRVEYVYPTLQSDARSLKARIAIPNPEGRIKPGMYATVRLRTSGRAALTVPTAAVVNTGERALVFVDEGDGSLLPQEVEVGRVAGDFTEVLSGLEPGQRVVTSAQFILDSESNLAEVMKSMIGMTGSGDMEGMDMGSGSMDGMETKGADMKGMSMPAKER
ncbi:efflux RND transporter periplasmic adaptor subunit [soil metagenome]